MRRTLVLWLLALTLVAAHAAAETIWVEKAQLVTDPADPRVLTFPVEIREPGSYQVRLLVRGESERRIELELALRPEAGGPVRVVHFSFTGRGCG
jgi:hypothetical protein